MLGVGGERREAREEEEMGWMEKGELGGKRHEGRVGKGTGKAMGREGGKGENGRGGD